ncbi:hypothetical protein [Streptomyces sp. NPDC005336]|uniref:hypothetical protein n=1 Tax=Streptomyces sp. NPDC005336 TaxID=3157035 RepID=UPI0033B8F660
MSVRARAEDGALVYRRTLKRGASVPAGGHVFAGHYRHAEGHRDTGRDGYAATGHGASGAFAVRGDFPEFPPRD